jgi:DNA-binding response OmpR family regulator
MRPGLTLLSYKTKDRKPAIKDENVLMAKILIIESNEDLERLYAAVVRGLGHEPAFLTPATVATVTETVDLVLVEPASAECLEAATKLRASRPGLPIVCASLHGRTADIDLLEPLVYLVKPFTLVQLTDAIEAGIGRNGNS